MNSASGKKSRSTYPTSWHCFVQLAGSVGIAGIHAFFSYHDKYIILNPHAAAALVLIQLGSCSFSQEKSLAWLGGGIEGVGAQLCGQQVSFLSIFFTEI